MIYYGRILTEEFYNEQHKYIDFFLYPILQVTYAKHLKLFLFKIMKKEKQNKNSS